MPETEIGLFLPTTQVWDPSEIFDIDVNSPQFKELLVRLYQNLNSMAVAINLKDTGYYDTSEFVTGQKFFITPGPVGGPVPTSLSEATPDFRQTYRKVINFGALANTGSTSIAHGITVSANTIFTRIYGVANDPVAKVYLPLPYASPTLVENIKLSVDNTNVIIVTGSDRSAYTITYIVVEYLKF